MQLTKPIKKISYYFENRLNEKIEQALLSSLIEDVPNDEVEIWISDDKETMHIKAEDIDELNKLRELSRTFLQKKKLKYNELFRTSIVIELPEEEAFKFLNMYFSKPYEEAEFLCVGTRFVCKEDNIVFLISMELENEKQISIEASDTVENNESIKQKYEKATTMIHKIVKY